MSAPTTREELEATNWFKWGVEARKKREAVSKGLRMLRVGSWQYDAYVAGYDATKNAQTINRMLERSKP